VASKNATNWSTLPISVSIRGLIRATTSQSRREWAYSSQERSVGNWLALPSSLYWSLQINAGRSLHLLLKAGGSRRRLDFTSTSSDGVQVEGGVVWEGDEPLLDF
jgi:hypothetical protein